MSTMIFVNFPVSDLNRSIAFYSALGFKQNHDFSNENVAAMMWDDKFWIMVLTHDFYKKFIKDREIADTSKTSSVLVAFSLESAQAVKEFGEIALANGGSYYHVDMGMPEDMMFGLEVQDPDGNMLEPSWMLI